MANIKVKISLHKFGEKYHRPHRTRFITWAETTVNYIHQQGLPEARAIAGRLLLAVNVRLVTEEEMRHINAQYRRKAMLTTVLSFPCEDSAGLGLPDFGDIVMCGKAIVAEATEYHLDINVHWGHLFIHSMLHLLGFKHGTKMERIENAIMLACNLPALHD